VKELAADDQAKAKPEPETDEAPEARWLDEAQARTWITFMQVQLRLSYEMNRQLLSDSRLQLGDYHVLSALSTAPQARLQVSALATYVGWERSRMSHHAERMARRGLVERVPSLSDRRATDIRLTDLGWDAITRAAPGHVALVRRLVFDGLPAELAAGFQAALDAIYQTLITDGTLAAPPPPGVSARPAARPPASPGRGGPR
jgi:DNA-binding MarR family transcriptional regulator